MRFRYSCKTFGEYENDLSEPISQTNVFNISKDLVFHDNVGRFLLVRQSASAEIGILKIAGDLDIMTSPRLSEEIQRQLERGAVNIIVNLAGVRFMDCSGLRVLLEGLVSTQTRGGSLILISPPDLIMKLLRITGLNRLFKVYETEEEAFL